MIREFHLADWFTLGNAVCGVGALFSCMTYLETHDLRHIYFACTLVLAALVFDVLDGRIARWRQKSSAMGRELDSLADVISFGVAPAIIAYACGMQGLYDRVVLAFFVACGVSRLARFNITAEALAEGRPAIVEARDADAFRAASARLGVSGRAVGTVRGHNYSEGDDVSLTVYAPPPRPVSGAAAGADSGADR